MRIRYRSALIASYVTIAALVALSYFWQAAQIDQNLTLLAHERGSVLFRLIELTRDWNARHGGVYVPVTKVTQPNPYLEVPRRDIVTTDGQQLTLVNPAFMTRQIAEIAEQADGVRFHITSLNLVRPENAADGWEAETLRAFEKREISDRLSFFADGGGVLQGPVHRFMAPLEIKEACLQCHKKMGYKIGDVRGGISVTMPAGRLLEVAAQQHSRLAFASVLGFIIIAALAHLALRLARSNLLAWQERERLEALEAINRNQETLIAERTQQLSQSNAALAEEVRAVESARRELESSQSSYRAVVDSSQDGILILRGTQIVFVNQRMQEIVGFNRAEMMRLGDVTLLLAPQNRAWCSELANRQAADGYFATARRVQLLHKDGITQRTADLQLVPWRETEGETQLVVSFKDVTEQLAADRALSIAATVFESAAEGIMVTDRGNRILQINPAFTAITGYSASEAIGQTPALLKSGYHDRDFYAAMWRQLLSKGQWNGEIRNRRKNAEMYFEHLSISALPDNHQGDGAFVATFSDITQRKVAEDIIAHQASHDPLTDLPNRRTFEDRLEMALAGAHRHQRIFALLYLDLDHFKQVNDSLGHAAGDMLLTQATRRMLICVRADDTLARLGGDEFAIILSDLESPQKATEIACRLIDALGKPYLLEGTQANVTASIGIAIHPHDGKDAASLRQCADAALYRAKAAGRNGWCDSDGAFAANPENG